MITGIKHRIVFLIAFMFMAGSSIIPDQLFYDKTNQIILVIGVITLQLFVMTLIFFYKNKLLLKISLVISLVYVLYIPFLFGGYIPYGLEKLFLAFTVPLLSVSFLYTLKWDEEKVIKCFLFSIFIFLLVAIIYKMHGNFLSRGRFGLLGPIPFGWICALAAIAYYMKVMEKRGKRNIIYFLVFCICVLWTGSKGPFLGLLISILIITTYFYYKSPKYLLILGIFVMIIILLLTYDSSGRIVSTYRALISDPSDYINGVGHGSIGTRIAFIFSSIEAFVKHPFIGYGLGEWEFKVGTFGYKYPHNLLLETIVETGLIGGLAMISLIVYSLYTTFRKSKILGFMSFTGFLFLLVSGDMGYIRYPLFLVLLSTLYFSKKSYSNLK